MFSTFFQFIVLFFESVNVSYAWKPFDVTPSAAKERVKF